MEPPEAADFHRAGVTGCPGGARQGALVGADAVDAHAAVDGQVAAQGQMGEGGTAVVGQGSQGQGHIRSAFVGGLIEGGIAMIVVGQVVAQ